MTNLFPFFSIIIPTLNRGDRLLRAIQSVLNQSYSDFELIVVDDGSKNEVGSVIKDISDGRIKFVRNERSIGAAASRNRGVELATGQWVLFLDDDDIFFKGRLREAVKAISAKPTALFGIFAIENSCEESLEQREFLPVVDDTCLFALRLSTTSLAVKREKLLALGGFDPQFVVSEDRDLILSLLEQSADYFVSEKPLAQRTFHSEDQLSKRVNALTQAESDRKMYEKHLEYLSIKPELCCRLLIMIAKSYATLNEFKLASSFNQKAGETKVKNAFKYRIKAKYYAVRSFLIP